MNAFHCRHVTRKTSSTTAAPASKSKLEEPMSRDHAAKRPPLSAIIFLRIHCPPHHHPLPKL